MSEELDPAAVFDAVKNVRAAEHEASLRGLEARAADPSRRPLPGEALPDYLKRMGTLPPAPGAMPDHFEVEPPLGGRTPTELEQQEMARGTAAGQMAPAQLEDVAIDGVLEIETDGMADGTTVRVNGKILRMVQSIRLEITPEGPVRANLTVLCAKLKLKGRVISLERADPPPAAPAAAPAANPSGGQAYHVPKAPGA